MFNLNDFSNYGSSNYRSFLIRAYKKILNGPNNFFDIDDFSNYRSSNYMSSTVILLTFTTQSNTHRSSLPKLFCKKGVLKSFVKSTRKQLHRSLSFKLIYQPSGLDSSTGVSR